MHVFKEKWSVEGCKWKAKNTGKYNGRDIVRVDKTHYGKILYKRNGKGWNEGLSYTELNKNTNSEVKTAFKMLTSMHF